MTEPTKTTAIAVGRAGGSLATFIPQNMDEVKRMAQWAAIGGMAPKSLTDNKSAEAATAACAIAIMAGAELGLTPMMALRSYAVVNGRPTLWGDGLIAVVMKSPVYKPGSLKKGYDEARKVGFCEAERTDGTIWREEFSETQARKANLLSKKGPWQEYPDVMMTRRAINKCLNFLFADVLGGFVTEDEAYEYVDVTPNRIAAPVTAPEVPPEEPPPAAATTPADAAGDFNDDASEVADPATGEFVPTGTIGADEQRLLDALNRDLGLAPDEPAIEQAFDDFDVQTRFAGNDAAIAKAFTIKAEHLSALHTNTRQALEAEGQGALFAPEVPE